MTSRPLKFVDQFYSSSAWRALRNKMQTKWRAAGKPPCAICGQPIAGMPIVDHVKDRKRHPGLALMESNLRICCSKCNSQKAKWEDNRNTVQTGADGFPKDGGWG